MDLSGMQLSPQAAKPEDLDALPLPKDLRAFLEQHNGGLGMLGNRPLDLWSAAQIAKEAESQDVSLAIPGLLLFGSDGGAEGYGHLARLAKKSYGRISLLAAGVHEFEGLADTFDDFLKALSEGR
jgi:SMI1 / KNR4 family (SUKH-1)